jgi:hypothetical protein
MIAYLEEEVSKIDRKRQRREEKRLLRIEERK